jgi:hypothetical protein
MLSYFMNNLLADCKSAMFTSVNLAIQTYKITSLWISFLHVTVDEIIYFFLIQLNIVITVIHIQGRKKTSTY